MSEKIIYKTSRESMLWLLSHPLRYRICKILKDGDISAKSLIDSLNKAYSTRYAFSNVSTALRELQQYEVVSCRQSQKDGRSHIYHVNIEMINDALRKITQELVPEEAPEIRWNG